MNAVYKKDTKSTDIFNTNSDNTRVFLRGVKMTSKNLIEWVLTWLIVFTLTLIIYILMNMYIWGV